MMRIGIYIGSKSDTTNQYSERLLYGWGECLSKYDLDAFGSADFPMSVTDMYNRYETAIRGYRTPFTKIRSVYQDTVEYINVRDPDLLLQYRTYSTHASGVALAGWQRDVPVITRLPADSFSSFKGAKFYLRPGVFLLHNVCGRIPIRLSEKIIALGPYSEAKLLSAGASSKDIAVIPPPRDYTGRFAPVDDKSERKRELGLPTDRPVALFVGKLIERKGMEFLLDVLESVIPKTEICFVLVGPGPYQEKLDAAFDEERVKTIGHVEYSEVDRYYKAADLYIHPSAFEGIPLTILEAWDCDVPVIARDAGDISYLIGDTVITPEEMVEKVCADDWSTEWRNEKYFEHEYQQRALTDLIDEVLGG